jgi:ADP-ribose pyrophosphatase YjhB (NUDIX family)
MTPDRQAPLSASLIRPIAIGIFRRADSILVGHGRDALKDQRYCRPPGGAIEFGERAADALRREIREEVHVEIAEPRLLGVLETTFQLEGLPKHELVFVFEATFKDDGLYQLAELPLYEAGWDGRLTWETIGTLRDGPIPLYPEGLIGLLNGTG